MQNTTLKLDKELFSKVCAYISYTALGIAAFTTGKTVVTGILVGISIACSLSSLVLHHEAQREK